MRKLLIALTLLAACSKDNDPAPIETDSVDVDVAIELAEDVSPAADVTAADLATVATAD